MIQIQVPTYMSTLQNIKIKRGQNRAPPGLKLTWSEPELALVVWTGLFSYQPRCARDTATYNKLSSFRIQHCVLTTPFSQFSGFAGLQHNPLKKKKKKQCYQQAKT